MDSFAVTIRKWWERPFTSDMSGTGWVLFLGLLIVIIIGWNTVVKFITEG